MDLFDRTKLEILPLSKRESKLSIEEIAIEPDLAELEFHGDDYVLENVASKILQARDNNKPVILAFGAHLIKNGLGLVVNRMIEENYITHLATNGAGSIHDWEFAFQGKSTEDVQKYLTKGQFGIWEETGRYINLALVSGAERNKGYGDSVSEMIYNDGIPIPGRITQGLMEVEHPFKKYSVQNSAFGNGVPFTVHPCFGQDIINTHPLSDGASIGKCAEIDFLKFTDSVSKLEGGVYLSVGSAIMSPMIFEKALSMSRNVARQEGKKIDDFMIVVNDMQEGNWDWGSDVEPSKDDPAYYLRFCKTFSRAGAREMHYIQEDNRNFLVNLYQNLKRMVE
jgi:hypothetical protein